MTFEGIAELYLAVYKYLITGGTIIIGIGITARSLNY